MLLKNNFNYTHLLNDFVDDLNLIKSVNPCTELIEIRWTINLTGIAGRIKVKFIHGRASDLDQIEMQYLVILVSANNDCRRGV